MGETGCRLHVISMGEGLPQSSSTSLSNLPGWNEVVVQGRARSSSRKKARLGLSNEGERACKGRDTLTCRSPRAHPASTCLEWREVGEC